MNRFYDGILELLYLQYTILFYFKCILPERIGGAISDWHDRFKFYSLIAGSGPAA